MLSNFWWGEQRGKHKMSWVVCKEMCKTKFSSGFSFWDLNTFNYAFFTKQVWRLTTFTNSLCYEVLKVGYFSNEDIWSCHAKPSDSFTWRSILKARDAIHFGYKWRIGNGKRVQFFKDEWLTLWSPRRGLFRYQFRTMLMCVILSTRSQARGLRITLWRLRGTRGGI